MRIGGNIVTGKKDVSHTNIHNLFLKSTKPIQRFSTNAVHAIGYLKAKRKEEREKERKEGRKKLGLSHTSYTKINPR